MTQTQSRRQTRTATKITVPVAVVVPVYRVAATVAACLQSVAEQTVAAQQVILVDDAGGDCSIEVAVAAAERLGLPYEVITHEQNAGLGAARNSGLRRVSAEYVWFLDSDDSAEPTFLADLLQALTTSESDFVVCRTLRTDPSGAELGVVEGVYWRRVCPGPEVARELLRGRLRAYACNKIFRTDQLGTDPFPVGQAYEDFVPVLELALAARRVAVVNRPLYRYRDVPTSISNSFDRHTLDLLQVGEQLEQLFAQRGDTAAYADDLLVHRYLQVLLPVANMALRSSTSRSSTSRSSTSRSSTSRSGTSGSGGLQRSAVREVRRRIAGRDLGRLLRIGQLRLAVAAATLAVAPWLYAYVLRRR